MSTPGPNRPDAAAAPRAAAPLGPRYAPTSFTRRAALTAGTAASLTGLYAGYAATVTPLLESAALRAEREAGSRPTHIVPPKTNRELAERYLSHAPFAATADYQIGSGRSVMFWDQWKIVGSPGKRALKVTPFAIVIVDDAGTDPAAGGKPPTTIVADTAMLRFENPITEELVGNPGRVVGAVFNGVVRVEGEDGLQVVGSNFHYREGQPGDGASKLYSDNPVTFRHGGTRVGDELTGGHEGSGVGVEVKLFRTRGPSEYDSVAVDGLAEVAVRGPVDLTLRGGGLPGLDAAGGPLADSTGADADDSREPVHVEADGQLVFDPHANTAHFTSVTPQGVRAWREPPADAAPGADGLPVGPDQMLCDDLRVTFAPATLEARAEAAAMRAARAERHWGDRKFFAADDDLEAVAVIATGAPVRVNSPARQATVTAARLEHDVAADVLTLLSRPEADRPAARSAARPTPARSAGPADWVLVTLPDSVIRCPRLTVSPPDTPPDGLAETGDSQRKLRCAGPGTLLRTNPETGELSAKVSWPGSLQTSRNYRSGRDVVTLLGPANPKRDAAGHTDLADQVLVQTFAEGSDLAADKVVLELEPNPHAASSSETERSTDRSALAGADPMSGSLRPARAIARGSVRMKGPELLAGAKEVEVVFADPPPKAAVPPGEAVAGTPGGGNGNAGAEQTPADQPPAEPEPPGPPTKFYADAVVATVVRPRTENGVEVEEGYVSAATATGGVGLFQDAPPPKEPGGEPGNPRFAKAARAVVTGSGPGEQLLTLFGTPATATTPLIPAELHGSGADLTGPEIRFNPKENTATVVGSGSIDLPVRGGGMPGFVGGDDAPEPPAEPDAADGGVIGASAEVPAESDAARSVEASAGQKTVRVTWAKSMTFDGSVATFHGGARTLFHAVQGERGTAEFVEDSVSLFCQLMTVTLSEPVVFGDSLPGGAKKPAEKAGEGDPEIELITCHGRVSLTGRQEAPDPRHPDEGARLIPQEAQRLKASFAQLEVTWQTGDFTAEGPGEMRVWQRDDKTAPQPVRVGVVRPNARRSRMVALPCELIHVKFDRDVAGNLNGPDATFHPKADGRVEVVHGPVREFGAELMTAPNAPLPPGATQMSSHRLELRHVPATGEGADDKAKTRQLFASGDVEVDGHGENSGGRPGAWFWAYAPRAAYNEAKGRLELSGTADGSVRLYRADTADAAKDTFIGRNMVVFPATNTFDVKEVQGADGLP